MTINKNKNIITLITIIPLKVTKDKNKNHFYKNIQNGMKLLILFNNFLKNQNGLKIKNLFIGFVNHYKRELMPNIVNFLNGLMLLCNKNRMFAK